MRQVMAAVVYMHEKGVCHRDLKPENFLFLSNAPIHNNALKLIDFGLSRTFEAGTAKFWTKIGTPYYVAPQVLQGCYDELVDVWSAGVLMYVLLCGYPPFMGDNDKEITEAVLRGRFEFTPEDWDMISEDAKELIAWMLAFRPEHRSSAKEVLDHVWIHDMAPHAHSTVPLCARRVQNLQKFCSMHPFKKATLGVIASLLHEDKIAELRDMFRGMDKNGTGVLSAADLMEGMKKAGIGEIALDLLEMEQVVKACDENGSGGIDYTEFLAAAMDEAHYLQEDICWSAFCVFDRDGDGKISHAELCEVLHDDGVDMALAHATAEELIKQIDRAGDGAISFDEFMQMLRDQH
jgi:calcium-dependent protein kinase